MIQGKLLAMAEVARSLRSSRGGGRMKGLFSFVSKALGLFSRLSELSLDHNNSHFVFYYFHEENRRK